MRGRQTFPPISRLRSSPEYQNAWRTGQRYHTAHFIVIVADNDHNRPRLGLTVSRKVGHAVCRNRLKRWLRELFRCHLIRMNRTVDISIIAKRQAGLLSHAELDRELQVLFARLEANCHV